MNVNEMVKALFALSDWNILTLQKGYINIPTSQYVL